METSIFIVICVILFVFSLFIERKKVMKRYQTDMTDFVNLITGMNDDLDEICKLINTFDETKENPKTFIQNVVSKMVSVHSRNMRTETLMHNAKLECYMNDYINTKIFLFSFYRTKFEALKFNYFEKERVQIQKRVSLADDEIVNFTKKYDVV